MGTAIKQPVTDQVKPVWHRMWSYGADRL